MIFYLKQERYDQRSYTEFFVADNQIAKDPERVLPLPITF